MILATDEIKQVAEVSSPRVNRQTLRLHNYHAESGQIFSRSLLRSYRVLREILRSREIQLFGGQLINRAVQFAIIYGPAFELIYSQPYTALLSPAKDQMGQITPRIEYPSAKK
jgi:hypothetical protein